MSRDLFDDLKEKNAVAKSARTKVGGKGRYMMPSDYLSATEKKKLNGEITVYTMKEPISWQKFKGYPKDIQKEYLQWFADEFDASPKNMAVVFGLAAGYCGKCLKEMGLRDALSYQPTVEGTEKFRNWIKQYRHEEEVEETLVQEEPKKEKEKVKVVEQPIFFNTVIGAEMNFEGKASEISQTLFSLFRDQKIAVSVVFVGAKETEDAEVD